MRRAARPAAHTPAAGEAWPPRWSPASDECEALIFRLRPRLLRQREVSRAERPPAPEQCASHMRRGPRPSLGPSSKARWLSQALVTVPGRRQVSLQGGQQGADGPHTRPHLSGEARTSEPWGIRRCWALTPRSSLWGAHTPGWMAALGSHPHTLSLTQGGLQSFGCLRVSCRSAEGPGATTILMPPRASRFHLLKLGETYQATLHFTSRHRGMAEQRALPISQPGGPPRCQ